MPNIIRFGGTGAKKLNLSASVNDVLKGKTFSIDGKSSLTGVMVNRGAVNQTLAVNGSYIIPQGYHDGTGKVTQTIPTLGAATYTPGTSNKTIASGQYLTGNQTIVGDSNLVASNIKNGTSIFGVSGTYITGPAFAFLTRLYIDYSTPTATYTIPSQYDPAKVCVVGARAGTSYTRAKFTYTKEGNVITVSISPSSSSENQASFMVYYANASEVITTMTQGELDDSFTVNFKKSMQGSFVLTTSATLTHSETAATGRFTAFYSYVYALIAEIVF